MFGGEKTKLVFPRKVLWRWIFSYLKNHAWRYVAFMSLMMLGTIMMSASSLISRAIIDNGIRVGTAGINIVIMLSVVYLIINSFTALFMFTGSYGMGKVGQRIIFSIRNDLIAKLQHMSMAYFDKKLSGDIISITTNDVDQLNNLVGGQLVMIVQGIVSISLIFLVIFIMSPLLAIVSTIVFPVYLIAVSIFKRVMTGVFKEMRKKMSAVTSSIQENIAGAKVVQAFGQEQKAATEFDKVNQENYVVGLKMRKLMSTFFPLIGFISSLLTTLVLFVGGSTMIKGYVFFGTVVTPGTLIALIGLLSQFFGPFMSLMQFQQVVESAMAASDRIYGLLNEETDLPDPERPKPLPETSDVEFQNVSFGYKLVDNGKNNHGKTPASIKPDAAQGAMKMPAMMQKRIEDFVNRMPEPYKTFMKTNARTLPQDISRQLLMSLMGKAPEDVGSIIDKILADNGNAVPGSKMASEHQELKTTFGPAAEHGAGAGIPAMHGMPTMPEMPGATGMPFNKEMVLQMAKNLAKMLKPEAGISTGGGMGGGDNGGMGGGMGMRGMPGGPKEILRMLASMEIPADVIDELPDVVKTALNEEKVLLERERTVGFVLKNVEAKIPEGKTVAIVGETGAGKTTFIKLVSRFYDVNEGKVLIGGVDVRDLKKDELRRIIGMVPQDSFLFAGSIKENLLYGIKDETPDIEAKMIIVSKFLGLHNFIEKLPEGYDTLLKENASNISIGQRQLIAFARALMTDPSILILDEATSSVDPYTESLIQDALDKAREGRTTIIIAHRLSTIKNADWIFVLDTEKKGIIEQGTHDELVRLNGKYKRLLDMQQKEIDAKAA